MKNDFEKILNKQDHNDLKVEHMILI